MHYGRFAGGEENGEKSTASATDTLYLVWFLLDTTLCSRNNPPHLAASAAASPVRARPLGEAHAIFAGLDRAMHQSGLRRPRPLAARSSFRSQRRFGILPVMRQPAAGRTSTHRPTPPHEAALARRPSAAPAPSSMTEIFGHRA